MHFISSYNRHSRNMADVDYIAPVPTDCIMYKIRNASNNFNNLDVCVDKYAMNNSAEKHQCGSHLLITN